MKKNTIHQNKSIKLRRMRCYLQCSMQYCLFENLNFSAYNDLFREDTIDKQIDMGVKILIKHDVTILIRIILFGMGIQNLTLLMYIHDGWLSIKCQK